MARRAPLRRHLKGVGARIDLKGWTEPWQSTSHNCSQTRANHIGSDFSRSLPTPGDYKTGDPGEFGSILKDAVDKVDDVQKVADGELTSWVAGEQENLHEVMIAMNHAQLSMSLMTEVRNRLLDTYQELMRMQV